LLEPGRLPTIIVIVDQFTQAGESAMHASGRLLRKLQPCTPLTPDDVKAIERLPVTVKEFPAHTTVVREGERPTQCCLLIEGFIVRAKTTELGKRQIVAIHIAGEIPDLESLHLHVMDHDLMTLSRSVVGFIAHEALRGLTHEHPNIMAALWRETLLEAAVFREWIVNVGRRSAVVRLAHLLTELGLRLQRTGVAADRFELPMTQQDLADTLGLTPVHVNRVIQELRRDGLLELRKHSVYLPDLPRLKKLGDFDDLYLHWSETV
jgi:CRP-like cAMP-binding protein